MHFLTLIVLFEYFAEVNTFVVSIVSKKIHVSESNKETRVGYNALGGKPLKNMFFFYFLSPRARHNNNNTIVSRQCRPVIIDYPPSRVTRLRHLMFRARTGSELARPKSFHISSAASSLLSKSMFV